MSQTLWTYSIVMIAPAATKDGANAIAEALGHGPNNFSATLSNDGQNITHYGCRTQAQQSFVDLLAGMGQGEFPPIEGANPRVIEAILASLIIDIQDGADGATHFNAVLEANGLTRFEVVEEVV
jgi:hypothetical protein